MLWGDGTRDDGEGSEYEAKDINIPDLAADETVREVEPIEGGRGKWIKKSNPLRETSAWWKA